MHASVTRVCECGLYAIHGSGVRVRKKGGPSSQGRQDDWHESSLNSSASGRKPAIAKVATKAAGKSSAAWGAAARFPGSLTEIVVSLSATLQRRKDAS
jgi:hypothetical protein